MESEVLKYGWLIVLTLGQIIYIWMRMAKDRNHKKKEVPPNPGIIENPSHGERLMGLETDMENLRDENEKDHDLICKSIDKLSTRINGALAR